MIPVFTKPLALYHPPDEPMAVIDQFGTRWLIGYADGIRYKRRVT